MKYEFPYSGSSGKWDSWEGIIDVELSDEDYARIVVSSKGGFWHMCDDDGIKDIYDRIYEQIVDETVKNIRFMIDEIKSDLHLPADVPDREVAREYLNENACRISYPADIDPLGDRKEEKE